MDLPGQVSVDLCVVKIARNPVMGISGPYLLFYSGLNQSQPAYYLGLMNDD
jgi:hypothetical protein